MKVLAPLSVALTRLAGVEAAIRSAAGPGPAVDTLCQDLRVALVASYSRPHRCRPAAVKAL